MKSRIIAAVAMCLIGAIIINTAISHKKVILEEEKKSEESIESQKDETIQIWYTYSKYKDYIEQAVDAYKKQTGSEFNVNINFISDTGYFDYIKDKSLNGEGPDMFIMGSEYLEKAYLLGILEPNYNTKTYNKDNYANNAIMEVSYGTEMYGYPLGFDVSAFVVNNTYSKDTINTFEDIKAYADSFNDKSEDALGDDASLEETKDDIDHSKIRGILDWDVNSLLYNYGFIGSYISFKDGDKVKVDMNNDQAVEAASKYLLLKDYFSPTNENTYAHVIDGFAKGETVFVLASTDIIKSISQTEIDYSVFGMPDLTADIKCSGLSYTDILAVNPRSQNHEDSIALADFISNEYAKNMYEICGIISCKRNIEYDNEHVKEFYTAYEDSIMMPNLLITEDYYLIMESALKGIWQGDDIKESLDKLQQNYSERIN